MRFFVFLLLFFAFLAAPVFGAHQYRGEEVGFVDKFSIAVSGGYSYFTEDLPSTYTKGGLNLTVKFMLEASSRFSIGLQTGYIPYRSYESGSSKSDLYNIPLLLMTHIKFSDRAFQPYLLAGVGAAMLQTSSEVGGVSSSSSSTEFGGCLGAGVEYRISEKIGLVFESQMHLYLNTGLDLLVNFNGGVSFHF